MFEFFEERFKVRGGVFGVKGFLLYSGCLVCVKGRNGGGLKFVVEEVLLVSVFRIFELSYLIYFV